MAADGSIVIVADVDDKKAQAELNSLAKKIDGLNAKIKQAQDARFPLVERAEELGVQLDIAKAKLAEMQAAAAGTYTADQINDQKETVKSLQAQWNAVQTQVERYDRSIANATSQIKLAEARAGELSASLADAGEAGADAGKEAADGINIASTAIGRLEKRILGLAKRVFVFSVITRALRGLRTWLANAVKSNDQAAAAIARLKGALLTLAQPILGVVIPAFISLVNVLTKVISVIASVVSALFGTTVEQSAAAAENLYDAGDAMNEYGGAAKKAAKQLAAFDEINKLNESDGGDGADVSNAIAPLFEAIKNFKLPDWLENFAANLKISIDDVLFDWSDLTGEQIAEKVVAGLTALVGGVVGFAIGGVPGALVGTLAGLALGLVIDSLTFDHDGTLSKEEILQLISVAVWGLSGGILGLIIGGPAGAAIGFTAGVALSLFLNNLVFDGDGNINGKEIAGFLISLSPGGLIMLTRAVVLKLLINKITANWDTIKKSISETWEEIKRDAVIKWEEIKNKITGKASEIINTTAKKFAELPGKIAYWLGQVIPKLALWAAQIFLWSAENGPKIIENLVNFFATLPEKIFNAIIKAKDELIVWRTAMITTSETEVPKIVETILNIIKTLPEEFINVGRDIVTGFASGITDNINEVKSAFNSVIDIVESAINRIIDKVNSFGVDVPNVEIFGKYAGQHVGLPNIDHIEIPHLAAGAVIPPNREFLAVLGDQSSGRNIEAPEGLIRDIVAEEMNPLVGLLQQLIEIEREGKTLQVGETTFARVVHQYGTAESARIGSSLVNVRSGV